MPRNLTTAVALAVLLLLTGPATSRAETLVVANKSDHTVDLIDLASGRSLATLATGFAPHEVAVSAEGTLAVVSNYGDRDRPGSSLTVIDLAAAKLTGEVTLADHTRPHGITFVSEDRVVVTTEGSRHLLLVDLRPPTIVSAIATEQETSHMVTTTPDGRQAFVANIGSGTVTAIDLSAGRKLRDIATGEGAEGITRSPDGKEVWVTNRAADTLSVIDTATLEVVATLPCPGFPIRIAITPDGERALVSAARNGEVVLFDTEERVELKRARLHLSNAPDASRRLFGDRFGESPVPVGLIVAPAGDRAWVAATQADVVVVLDPEELTVRDLIEAGREPDGIAFSRLELATEASLRH